MAARSPAASPRSARPTARKRCTGPGCRKLAPAGRKRCDDHKPGRTQTGKIVYGCTEPRIWTRPLRPLTRQTSHGYAVADFAEMIGEPLLPWERWVAIHALELLPDGHYRFRTVLVMAARQNGKSHLKRIVTLWRMYVGGARRVLGVAQDVALARDQWNMCQETIHDTPDLEEEWGTGTGASASGVRNVNGDEMFWASGCRYSIKAFNRRAGRGGSNDEVTVDELREAQDWKGWAAVSKTTNARADGQVWAMSNAGDDESVVLNQLQAAAQAGANETLGIFEYSAPDGCELDDIEAIRQANPGLGYIITLRAILAALDEPPVIYRTEVLCQHVDALESAIDAAGWKAGADPTATMGDDLRKRLGAVFDISIDGKHCTLVTAATLIDGKVRVEEAGTWDSTEAARAELPALLAKIKPVKFGWFSSGPAAAMAPMLRELAKKYNQRGGKRQPGDLPDDGEMAGATVSAACMGLADLVSGRQIVHGAQPLLDAHISGSRKLQTGDGWRFTRRGGGHCDAAYAAAGAVYLALTMPERKIPRIRLLSA